MTRTLAIDVGGTNFSVAIFDDEKLTAKATKAAEKSAAFVISCPEAYCDNRSRARPCAFVISIGFGTVTSPLASARVRKFLLMNAVR